MATLNLSQNGPSITSSYQKIVNSTISGPAASSPTYGIWAVFSVKAPLANAFQADSGKESVLSIQTTGEGELSDLIEEFSDGRIQFAYVKVKDPNTTLPKSVLIAWCGEGVPERTKGYFTSHLNAISRLLHGYHVQVTARSDRDLTPEVIVQKVADSSGSKYSGGGSIPVSGSSAGGPPPPVASKPVLPTKSFGVSGGVQPLGSRTRAPQPAGQVDADGWGEDAPQVTRSQLEKVAPAYKPTTVNMGQLQSQRETSRFQPEQSTGSRADVVSGGYQPIGKVDIAAIRRQAEESGSLKDDRPTVVKGSYEPIGKVDIADIRRKAQGAPPAFQPAEVSPGPADEDERPRSLADRSAAFTQAGRLAELPKPKVANRFGANTTSFAGTKAPAPGGFEAKPISSAAPVGAASKAFADEGGKTPAQIWAEKKARERGNSGAAGTQQSIGSGAPAAPIASQSSGGWQSGYAGKKWDVQIPSRSGGDGVNEHSTGQDDVVREEEETAPAAGGVGSIRDRFAGAAPMGVARGPTGAVPEPPPLDTASKPNAGVRGVPMPGLPQRPPQQDIPAQQHQDIPPPPRRPQPDDEEEEDEEEAAYIPQGSPVRIAMPVAREPEPIEPAEPLPPRPVPTASLAAAAHEHYDPEPEPSVQEEQASRATAQEAAASTFGHVNDTRGAGDAGGKEAIVQFDYTKDEDNEIELHEGERITHIEMVDEDWWMGENSRGERGLFPSNYVELVAGGVSGSAAPSHPAVAEQEAAPPAGPPHPAAGATLTATAEYDYEAAEDNELSFPDGAKITNVEFPDADWWSGEYNGKVGLFPANYVRLDE